MANYNLTNQEIRNSFQQLGQLSGSVEGGVSGYAVLDGTGSRATTLHVTASNSTSAVSASYAVTASFALNGGGGTVDTGSLLVTSSAVNDTITFTKGDGSTYTNVINNVSASLSTQEIFINAKNVQGVTIPKGTVVHSSGVTGENVNITTASFDDSSLMPAIGITQTDINAGAVGEVVISGRLKGIDTSGLIAGANVYVGGQGALIATKPFYPALVQNIGVASKIDGTDGEIIVMGAGRSNDLPNIQSGYAWVGDANGQPQAVATSSFGGGAAFPFTGNAQITGSLVVSGSGLSSGDDVFLLGFPRTGGSSLQGVIRSTVDDGLHFYGNKAFNNGANTFGGGQIYIESGPVNIGSAGTPVNFKFENGSAITASNGTLPISGNIEQDGYHLINGATPSLQINTLDGGGTPNVNMFQNYSGSAAKFANITIADLGGVEPLPTLLGRFANATPFGGVGAGSFTVLAGGGGGGEFNHWAFVMDQTSDIKVLKELAMRQGANITGSLDVSGAITASNASFQSASIGHLQTITGSATIIGDQYIILNADSPTQRFAGVQVYDSGSGLTGSFEWDSVDDNWIQVETGGSSAGMLTGPSGSKGSEVYPTAGNLIKGTGNHTVVDSIISDNGATATINGDARVTGTTQLDSTLNFSNFVDIKQQAVNILTGSASNLKLRSDNFTITDISNDVYANFDNNVVDIKKDTKITGSLDITGSLSANLEEISSGDFDYRIPTISGSGADVKFVDVKWSPRVNSADGKTYFGQIVNGNFSPAIEVTGSYDATGAVSANNLTAKGGQVYVGDSSTGTATTSVNMYGDYSGSAVRFNSINFTDVSGTYPGPPVAFFGAFSGPIAGNTAGDPFALMAGGAVAGENANWGIMMDQSGDIKTLKKMSIRQGADITGSLAIDGQVTGGVTSLAIASTTASMDFNDGNFFNLTLANGVDTHLDATNIAAGQTITLTVTNNATAAGTLSFSPDFKFAGGSAPTVTAATNAVDILTFVTTDATNVYGTGLLNFS